MLDTQNRNLTEQNCFKQAANRMYCTDFPYHLEGKHTYVKFSSGKMKQTTTSIKTSNSNNIPTIDKTF